MTSRRDFLERASALAVLGLGDVPSARWRPPRTSPPAMHDGFPRQDPATVESVVLLSHNNPDEVRKLVEAQPSLARASWDWGFGDWETCLGAASHTGRRDIAEVLLAHGARPTIFSAAMMGQLDVVRAWITTQPSVAATLGPHGISLLAHARAGGNDAAAVRAYLETIPEANRPLVLAPIDEAVRASLEGRYRFGTGARDYFDVDIRNTQLGIQRPNTNRRFLLHVGDLVFTPSGVPSVRIVFATDGARGTQLTVADPDVFLTARRQS